MSDVESYNGPWHRVIAMMPAEPGWEWQCSFPHTAAELGAARSISEPILMWLLCEIEDSEGSVDEGQSALRDTIVLPGVAQFGRIIPVSDILHDLGRPHPIETIFRG